MGSVELGGLAVLTVLAFAGGVTDTRSRRLPNALSGMVLLCGLAWSFVEGGLGNAGSALAHSLLALLAGAGLFAMKWVGGGDAKFYAAFAAWFPLQAALTFFLSVTILGGLLALVWLTLVARIAARAANTVAAKGRPERSMPYGIAISAGAVMTFFIQ